MTRRWTDLGASQSFWQKRHHDHTPGKKKSQVDLVEEGHNSL